MIEAVLHMSIPEYCVISLASVAGVNKGKGDAFCHSLLPTYMGFQFVR